MKLISMFLLVAMFALAVAGFTGCESSGKRVSAKAEVAKTTQASPFTKLDTIKASDEVADVGTAVAPVPAVMKEPSVMPGIGAYRLDRTAYRPPDITERRPPVQFAIYTAAEHAYGFNGIGRTRARELV